jgi:hypothetical protein
MRKGTNEKQAGNLMIRHSRCAKLSVLPFSGFHIKPTYLQAKRKSESRYKNTSRKKAPKNNNNTIFKNGKP